MKKIQNDTEIIINAIKKTLDLKNNYPVINLHEPSFQDTNAYKYVKDCLDNGWVSSAGEWVDKFEKQICKYTGAKYAVAVTNCTVGLRLSLHCIGVKNGDEVITSPLTFVASANAISHLGATPHFVDIDSSNLSLSSKMISKRLEEVAIKKKGKIYNKDTGKRIAAILPIHVFGIPGDILELKKVADYWNLPIVEDAAEALGSKVYLEKNNYIHCGLIGDVGVISFNGNKLITTGGGGVIITNNKDLAKKCRHLSTTAKEKHKWEFNHNEIGWNDRMPNINAALGVAQLEVIEKKIYKKNKLLERYKHFFSNIENVEILIDGSKNLNNYWLINLRFLDQKCFEAEFKKNELLEKSHNNRILIRPVWKLLHQLKMYKNNPKGNLTVAEYQSSRIISLPSSPELIKTRSFFGFKY